MNGWKGVEREFLFYNFRLTFVIVRTVYPSEQSLTTNTLKLKYLLMRPLEMHKMSIFNDGKNLQIMIYREK